MVGEGDLDWTKDFGFDASVFADFGEEFWGSGASFAEVEVAALDDDRGFVLFDDLIKA